MAVHGNSYPYGKGSKSTELAPTPHKQPTNDSDLLGGKKDTANQGKGGGQESWPRTELEFKYPADTGHQPREPEVVASGCKTWNNQETVSMHACTSLVVRGVGWILIPPLVNGKKY